MFLELFERIATNPFCQDLAIIFFVVVVIYVYMKSKDSTRFYKCPNCGEIIKVEHMKAKFCNLCGHAFEESITDVEDK